MVLAELLSQPGESLLKTIKVNEGRQKSHEYPADVRA